jgi:hypothetical protein
LGWIQSHPSIIKKLCERGFIQSQGKSFFIIKVTYFFIAYISMNKSTGKIIGYISCHLTGCMNPFASSVVLQLLKSNRLSSHLVRLRTSLKERKVPLTIVIYECKDNYTNSALEVC